MDPAKPWFCSDVGKFIASPHIRETMQTYVSRRLDNEATEIKMVMQQQQQPI